MTVVNKPVKRIMRAFKIDEISSVDFPAQVGAQAKIMKERGMPARVRLNKVAKLARLITKYYVDPADGAKPFGEVLEQYSEEQKYSEICNQTWPLVSALDTSLRSIIGDKDIEATAKQTMMRAAVEEFLAAIKEKWPEVEEVLEKALESVAKQEESDMAKIDELEKQLAELQKSIAGLSTGNDAAKKVDELSKQVADLTKALADKDAELAKAKAAEDGKEPDGDEMSDDEKEFYNSLKGDAKKEFKASSKSERKAKMKSAKTAKAGEETIEVFGQTIAKSAVGDAMFAVLKAQATEVDSLRKQAASEREAREMMEFTKRAEAELSHLPGTIEEKAKMLKGLSTLGEDARKSLDTMLKAGEAAISKAFDTFGHGGSPADVAKGQAAVSAFEKRVSEIKTTEKCSHQEAMRKARTLHPQEFEAYQAAQN